MFPDTNLLQSAANAHVVEHFHRSSMCRREGPFALFHQANRHTTAKEFIGEYEA